MELKYIIKEKDLNLTLSELIKKQFSISSRLYQNLIKNNCIFINENLVNKNFPIVLNLNDILLIDLNYEEDNSNIVPLKMKLDIVYEDDWILIVNKPVNIPVHPSMDHFNDSLSNGIRFYFDSISLKKLIRPVNRLDTNTSGLVIFAKCDYIHSILSNQMQHSLFIKKYMAVVDRNYIKRLWYN